LDAKQHDKGLLNQVDLSIERTIDFSTHQWDVGGRIDLIVGTDPFFFHSNGLLDKQNAEYQVDLYQAYFDVGVPIGNGLRVRAGKFWFVRSLDPNQSVFYTHTISFNTTFPVTQTGVTALYRITDRFNLEGGFSRGWDQFSKDNNGAIDGLARFSWDITDRSNLNGVVLVGPEAPGNNSNYTTLVNLTFSQQIGDKLTFIVNGLYGHQTDPRVGNVPGAITVTPVAGPSSTSSTANWFGVSGDVIYQINEVVSIAARGEWYRDDKGFTTGLWLNNVANFAAGPASHNLYEATLGLLITPFYNTALGDNFKLRPEVRYDYSNKPYFNSSSTPFSKHDQFTFAIDAIFNF
jgi:hypothetical protein